MEISPSLTAIGTTTTQISEFVDAHSIITREAKTNVTCYDEQTIIMGGLILTNDDIREDRIPVLGDLDWLGTMFRSKDDSTTRNELVIFLTPRIMHNKARQREVTLDELRTNDTLRTVVRNHSLKGKSFDTIIDPELRQEVEKISEEIPPTKREQRDENMRRTIETLEIVPEDVYKGDFYYQRNDIEQKRLAAEAEKKRTKQVVTPDEMPVKRPLYVPTEVEADSK
jgi:Flp pilus assembly secretin CpaC